MGATRAAGSADDGTNGASVALPTAIDAQHASVPDGRRGGARAKSKNAAVLASASAGTDTAAAGGGDAENAGGTRKPRGKTVSRARMKNVPNPPNTESC